MPIWTATTAGVGGTATSSTATLPPWSPGDICMVSWRGGSASGVHTFPPGWDGIQGQVSGQYAWAFATRTMVAGDGATVTLTTNNSTTWSWAAVRCTGTGLAIGAASAALTTPAAGNAVTAPPLTAEAGKEVTSVILAVARAATNTTVNAWTFTPPAGWTAGQSAFADLNAGSNQRWAGSAYLEVPTAGAVAPGPLGLTIPTGAAFWMTARHWLITATPEGPVPTAWPARVWDGTQWQDLTAPRLATWTGQEWDRLR